jgi:hypothetical protein
MRNCNGCTVCCTWLYGDSYGWEFGAGKSCKFLDCDGCSVHKVRPKSCENYFCAWAQELIDDEFRPDQCGFLISVENNAQGQYLKIIETTKDSINKSIIEYFDNWSQKMNTPIVIVKQQ